ncbi:MAG: signal peptidase II [Caulobacteraceae bacterium]
MRLVSRMGGVAYLLAAAVVIADQLVKRWLWAGFHLADRGVVEVFGPIQLHLVWNRGVSFGLFRDFAPWTRWALAGFSLLVAIGLGLWARRTHRLVIAVAAGLLMGGAVGNLIDRLRLGAVMDYIDASRIHFPWVFNIADSAITGGIILLLAESAIPARKTRP